MAANSEGGKGHVLWTPELDAVLIGCMQDLVQGKTVENGKFAKGGFRKLMELMYSRAPDCGKTLLQIKNRHRHFKEKYTAIYDIKSGKTNSGFGWDNNTRMVTAPPDVYAEWVKEHREYSGLNKKEFNYYDQLATICGKDRAMGDEAISAADVGSTADGGEEGTDAPMQSTIVGHEGVSMPMDDATSEQILEHMINEGVDGRTFLNEGTSVYGQNKAGQSSNAKRNKVVRGEESRNELRTEIIKFRPLMEQANVNIARIADSLAEANELPNRKKNMLQELSMLEGLESCDVVPAAMMLLQDDPKAELYYQLPKADCSVRPSGHPEAKVQFIHRLIH